MNNENITVFVSAILIAIMSVVIFRIIPSYWDKNTDSKELNNLVSDILPLEKEYYSNVLIDYFPRDIVTIISSYFEYKYIIKDHLRMLEHIYEDKEQYLRLNAFNRKNLHKFLNW